MSPQLMLAILSMDAYNRGYLAGLDKLGGLGSKIGNFTFNKESNPLLGSDERSAGFYAAGYTAQGGTGKIISYRGTDNLDPLSAQSDIWNGWTLGAGFPTASQGMLAAKFFEDFTGRSYLDQTSNDVILTGHSLGGGLAGFVGMLSGNQAFGFDHMPFGAAGFAQFLTDFNKRAIALGYDPETFPPTLANAVQIGLHLPSLATFQGAELEGEVNEGLRNGLFAATIGTALGALPIVGPFLGQLGTSIANGQVEAEKFLPVSTVSTYDWTNGSSVDRHSMATLVLMYYAAERDDGAFAKWHYDGLANNILNALYNNGVAIAAGADDDSKFSGELKTRGDFAAILRTAIAYSAIDEGDTVFGNTAIASLFDDAVNLGMAMTMSGQDGLIYQVRDVLSRTLTEFAGRLAFDSVMAADNSLATQGVLHLADNEGTLTVDFSKETWEVGQNYTNKLSSFKSEVLDTAIGNSVGSSDFNSALFEYAGSVGFQEEMTRLITSISFETNANPGSIDISLPSNPEGLNVLFLHEGSGANAEGSGRDRMIVGTSGVETIIGGGQRDLILGGAGIDVLTGGGGDDIIYGGGDADEIHADGADSGADDITGGEGGDYIYAGDQDTIRRPDAGDSIYFGDIRLKGARREASGAPSSDLSGTYQDLYEGITYIYDQATKTLQVHRYGEVLTITDFDNGEAGINLRTSRVSEPLSHNDTNKPPTGGDPLVLDLDGDGIELTDQNSQRVYFDLDGDGLADRVGWVKPDDGLLVRDLDSDGRITSLSEMFGTTKVDGFTVLANYDSNDDGVINASDDIWSSLKIWRDADTDGDTDRGELQSLAYYGITSISLNAQPVNNSSSNNLLAFTSSYQTANGVTREMAAAFMKIQQVDATEAGAADYPDAVYRLPDLTIIGMDGTLWSAMATDPELLGMVQDLVENARSLDSTGFRAAFVSILLRWTGVDAVDPSSMGAFADARHIAFLQETDAGTLARLADGSLSGGAANATIGALIEGQFDEVVAKLQSRFAGGLGASEQFLGLDPNGTSTGWFAGLFNATAYELRSDIVFGNAREIGYAFGVTAASLSDQLAYFEAVAPLVQGLARSASRFAFAYDWDVIEPEFGAGLHLAGMTDAALIEFATDRLHGSEHPIQLGTAADESLVAAAGKANMFVGRAGNDTLTGGDQADAYAYSLGDGNDVIIETADDDQASAASLPVDRLLLVGINRADVTIAISALSPDDIVLTFSDGGSIVLAGQLAGTGIEEIVFANGDRATASDLAELSLGTSISDGPDQIFGTRFDDVLNGLGGADEINGGRGNDRITGGAGNDTLIGNAGDDTYVYTAGDGDDVIDIYSNDAQSPFTNAVADFEVLELHGVSPDDITIRQNGLGYGITYLIGGAEPGSITVLGADNDIGIDEVRFDDGTIWGPHDIQTKMISDGATTGDDHIIGTEAPWYSDGSFGGEDDIAGGKGNDILEGLSGRDTYRYRLGDGNDTIIDQNGMAGQNRLVFDDLLRADLSFARAGLDGKDLLITVNRPEGGSILVKDGFGSEALVYNSDYYRTLSGITFADGTVLTMADLAVSVAGSMATESDDLIIGLEGIDTIDGLGGNDIIRDVAGAGIINGGDGDDVIDAYDSVVTGGRGDDEIKYAAKIIYRAGDGNDVVDPGDVVDIELVGIDRSDVTYAFADDRTSLIVQIGGTEPGSIKLSGIFGQPPATVRFGDGTTITSDAIAAILAPTTGTSGDDQIVGVAAFADTIIGLAGNDDLSGGAGADRYIYNPGDGDDTIHDGGPASDLSGWVRDELVLHGISPADVVVTRDGNDAVLTFSIPEQGSVRLVDQFLSGDIERILFDDGSRWTNDQLVRQTVQFGQDDDLIESNMDDYIPGTSLSETIEGAHGDDVIHSGGGHDLIIFNPGDGHDGIEALTDLSVIRLGFNPDQVTVVENNAPNSFGPLSYYLLFSNGETIMIEAGSRTPFIEFADGTSWSPDEVLSRVTVLGTAGSDDVAGHFGDFDEIFDLKGGSNDIVTPSGGSDTFIYRAGDGFLTIVQVDGATPGDLDTLDLRGIDPADVIVSLEHAYSDWGGDDVTPQAPLDLVLRFRGQDGAVIVKRAYHETEWSPDVSALERIRFEDGTTWNAADIAAHAGVYGTDVANVLFASDIGSGIIRGGGGDDRIFGVTENDEVHWAKGDGNDRLSRIEGAGILILDDVNPDEASFARSGNDLLVTIGGETITIVDQMSPTYPNEVTLPDGSTSEGFQEFGLRGIKFADGSEMSRQQLHEALPLSGTSWSDSLQGSRWADTISGLDGDDSLQGQEGNDTLDGGEGNDRLIAGEGDDALTGGAGNDLLNGGAGSDIYHWAKGDGNDVIKDKGSRYDGTDTLRLHGVSADDLEFARVGTASVDMPYDALRITIKSTGETITVDTQFLIDSLAAQFLSQFNGNRDGWEDGGGGPGPIGIMAFGAMSTDPSYSLTDLVWGIERIELDDGTVLDPFTVPTVAMIGGTPFDDQLQGSDADETFFGGGGSDSINGGGGIDTALYAGDLSNYSVWQTPEGFVSVMDVSGAEGIDVLSGIEVLKFAGTTLAVSDIPAAGTDGDDVITGSARGDVLFGLGGNDQITGGAGNDYADGGDGIDQARYAGSSSDFQMMLDPWGNLSVTDLTGAEGMDTYQNVEAIYFAGDDTTIQVADLSPPESFGGDSCSQSAAPNMLPDAGPSGLPRASLGYSAPRIDVFDHVRAAASFSEQLATFAPGAVADWTAGDLAERVDESWFAGRLRADGRIQTNAGGSLF